MRWALILWVWMCLSACSLDEEWEQSVPTLLDESEEYVPSRERALSGILDLTRELTGVSLADWCEPDKATVADATEENGLTRVYHFSAHLDKSAAQLIAELSEVRKKKIQDLGTPNRMYTTSDFRQPYGSEWGRSMLGYFGGRSFSFKRSLFFDFDPIGPDRSLTILVDPGSNNLYVRFFEW